MQFILISDYNSGTDEARSVNRASHLAYWTRENGTHMMNGGPLLGADGKPAGSMFMLEAEDEAQARALYDGDPYVKVGVARLRTVVAYRNAIRDGKAAT